MFAINSNIFGYYRSKTQLSADLIRDAPCLLTIGCFCIGTNQVDSDAALSKGVREDGCHQGAEALFFRFLFSIHPSAIVVPLLS